MFYNGGNCIQVWKNEHILYIFEYIKYKLKWALNLPMTLHVYVIHTVLYTVSCNKKVCIATKHLMNTLPKD